MISFSACAAAEVSRPDYSRGTYEEVVKDLEVKVLGGYVTLKRKYTKVGWQLNSNWRNLQFYDPAGTLILYDNGSIPGMGSDGAIIVKSGDPEPVIRKVVRGRFEYTPVSSNAVNRYVDELNPGQEIVKDVSGYRWSDRLGNWIQYNSRGETLSYGDNNDVSISFERDSSGRIVQVNDHFNNPILNYDYSTDGVLIVSDYSGRSVKYHGELAFMTKMTDVRGHEWHYQYTTIANQPYLSKKIDPEARETLIGHELAPGGPQTVNGGDGSLVWQIEEYTDPDTGEVIVREKIVDSSSSVNTNVTTMVPSAPMYTQMTYADGGKIDYRYYYNAQTQTYSLVEKSSDGLYTDRWFALDGKLKRLAVGGKILFSRAESHDGSLAIKTDTKGRKTTFHYDQWEKITSIVYPDDSSVTYQYHPQYAVVTEYVDENGYKTTSEYDEQFNLVKQTIAAGSANPRITEYEYDAYGQMRVLRRVGDTNTPTSETQLSYDNYGNITQITDAEGHITKYQLHNPQGLASKMVDARGKTWLYSYDDAGNLTQHKTPLGFTTNLVYDKVGNLASLTDPQLNLSQFSYDARDRLTSVINPLGDSSSIKYTLDGRPIHTVNEEGHQEAFEYDLQSRLKAVTNQEGLRYELNYEDEQISALARLDNIITPNGKIKLLLDKKGRVVQRSNASLDDSLSLATSFEYDRRQNITLQTDANNNDTRFTYNEHGQLISQTNALNQTTEFNYDSQGNLIKVKDAKSSETRYQYDRRGMRITEIKPMGQQLGYQYDAAGNLIERLDSKNQRITYDYDDDGRLTLEQHYASATATTAAKAIVYHYDKNNQLTGYDDGITSATYLLDDLGRLTSASINFGTFTKSYRYSYAKDGQISSFSNSEAVVSSYQYDKANRLQLIQIAGQGSIAYTQYQGHQPGTVMYPGGIKVSHSYDGIGRLTQQMVNDPAANPLQTSQYTMDDVGNVLTKSINASEYSYQYDTAYQLTQANQPTPLQNRTYQYDEVGNRSASEETANWNYNANHQLLSYGEPASSTTLGYDANGSTITKTITNASGSDLDEYSYDIANRLTELKRNGSTVARYSYDPFGRRLSKEVSGVKTYFLYANEGLVGEYNSSGVLINSYMYLPDSMWGTKPLGMMTGGESYFYQHDQLGSPNLVTSNTGQIKWQGAMDAFGQVQATTSDINNPLRFPGQYADSETGVHYNYFRDYDPEVGRYIQSDPIGLAGGVNTYGYVSGNPVNFYDPYGLYCFSKAERGGIKGAIQGAVEGGYITRSWQGALVGALVYGGLEFLSIYHTQSSVPSSALTGAVASGNLKGFGLSLVVTGGFPSEIPSFISGTVGGIIGGGFDSTGKGSANSTGNRFLTNMKKGAVLGFRSGFFRDAAELTMLGIEYGDDCGCSQN